LMSFFNRKNNWIFSLKINNEYKWHCLASKPVHLFYYIFSMKCHASKVKKIEPAPVPAAVVTDSLKAMELKSILNMNSLYHWLIKIASILNC
jgi:hypothetical protein